MEGANVEVCDAASCNRKLANGVTNAAGEISLEYRQPPFGTPAGYTKISGGPDRERVIYYDAPYKRQASRRLVLSGRRMVLSAPGFNAIVENAELPLDDSRPIVWVDARDCVNTFARSLRIEREGDPEEIISVNASWGRTGFLNIPDVESLEVRAYLPGQTDPVAKRRVSVQRDWWTEVILYPRRQNQPP